MDTTVGNIIIAEFLGFVETHHGFEDVKGILIEEEEVDHFKRTELKFHCEWNWLMEAVVACNQMPTTDSNERYFKELYNAVLTFDKREIWSAVINLIQHNEK